MDDNNLQKHPNDCDCGCDEIDALTITTDDGEEIDCAILGVFDVNEREYIALMPEDSDEVLVYRYKEEGDEVELGLIEEDAEFDDVSKAFEEFFEDLEDEE